MQQQSPKDILLHIFTLIDYKGDRQGDADTFLQVCSKEAAVLVLESLPEEKRAELQEQLKGKTEKEEIHTLLSHYLPSEEYLKAYQKVMKKNFLDFFAIITKDIPQEQNEKIQRYLTQISLDSPQPGA